MPTTHQRVFIRYNWRESVLAELVPLGDPNIQRSFGDDLSFPWSDSISAGLREKYLTLSDNLNSFSDVLDGFVESPAWNDSVSVVRTP